MIRSPDLVRRWEADYQRCAYRGLTYRSALERFAALWAQARLLNPEAGADWRDDLEATLAVARVLNGLRAAA